MQHHQTNMALPQYEGEPFRVLSWNVNGLLDKVKHTAILKYARRITPDVLLLQETHLMGNHCPILARQGFDRVWHLGFSSREAFLLRHSLTFTLVHTISDPQGQFVTLTGTLGNATINLVSLYIPPVTLEPTLRATVEVISSLLQGLTVIGGAFNAVLEPTKDATGTPSSHRNLGARRLAEWTSKLGLCDIW